MTAETYETGERGVCEICGAVDKLEPRTIVLTRMGLCQACQEVADYALGNPVPTSINRTRSS